MIVYSAIAAIVGTVAALVFDWFPTQASTAAGPIDLLYDVLLIASVPIFVLVMAVAIYCVVTFRAKPGDEGDGAPIHGNTQLEIVWVTVPFIMVTALAVYGWVVLNDIEAKEPDQVVVDVTAQQFSWSFEYPNDEGLKSSELVLPEGRQVEFRVNGKDVIHSFWVPEFRIKTDAPPGITTNVRVTPNRLGRYPVVCAELCGIGHSTMRQTVRVVRPQEFDAWLSERQQAARREGALGEGRRLFTGVGCAGCHTLADAGAQAQTGPPLEGLGKIVEQGRGGSTLREYLRRSIVDPKAFVVSGFSPEGMPANYGEQLNDPQLRALLDYLERTTGGGEEKLGGRRGEPRAVGPRERSRAGGEAGARGRGEGP